MRDQTHGCDFGQALLLCLSLTWMIKNIRKMFWAPLEKGLLNQSSCLAAALGVTKLIDDDFSESGHTLMYCLML